MTIALDALATSMQGLDNSGELYGSIANLRQALQKTPVDFKLAAESCKRVADGLRTAALRSPIGECGVIQTLATLLTISKQTDGQQQQYLFQIQALRVLGNLCFDHEENRKRVEEAGIVSLVASFLKEANHSDLIRIVCGFYLNSSMDYAPIQLEIAQCGAAEDLVKLLQSSKGDHSSMSMAIKTLDNIIAEDDARRKIATSATVKTYMTLIESLCKSKDYLDDLDLTQNLTDTLLQLIMDDESLQNVIYEMGSLDYLLNFLEDTEIVELEDKEEEEKFAEIRRALSKITVFAASTDAKMDAIYSNQHYLSKLLKMAKSTSEIAHQTAIYILGNLARTDQHCIELVEKYGLSKLLLDLYQSTKHATFQYAILGCLKHLCVPKDNKGILGDDNCIEIVSSMLDSSNDMLKRNQFLTIGVIKLLCTGSFKNAKSVIENDDILNSILAFIKRVDDIAAKSEATRILITLVKTIWVEKDSDEFKSRLIKADILEPIKELIRTTTFAILKNEGVLALTLVFSDHDSVSLLDKACLPDIPHAEVANDTENSNDKTKNHNERSLIQVLVDDICSQNNDLAVQIKCNMCLLLCKVVEAARSRKFKLVKRSNVAISDSFSLL
ncbi:armadillo-type protein [Mycotypha africana]|uniref:armadillo-type protein n=1 Tax=Mycotypha africana TaxID=64632 RepID=UPI002300FE97|nr:armadillo-type protein [Mycotypha africana]KAI8988486.1 armadillo-type protein [Mycotypha africana]